MEKIKTILVPMDGKNSKKHTTIQNIILLNFKKIDKTKIILINIKNTIRLQLSQNNKPY